ncbi:MAG: hypothetical protein HRT47_05085 [Candidatus Caenarcaniphilales bacterium]|nr:hypothetical protein [Candidatus Caenarcaniphilales bacterium]
MQKESAFKLDPTPSKESVNILLGGEFKEKQISKEQIIQLSTLLVKNGSTKDGFITESEFNLTIDTFNSHQDTFLDANNLFKEIIDEEGPVREIKGASVKMYSEYIPGAFRHITENNIKNLKLPKEDLEQFTKEKHKVYSFLFNGEQYHSISYQSSKGKAVTLYLKESKGNKLKLIDPYNFSEILDKEILKTKVKQGNYNNCITLSIIQGLQNSGININDFIEVSDLGYKVQLGDENIYVPIYKTIGLWLKNTDILASAVDQYISKNDNFFKSDSSGLTLKDGKRLMELLTGNEAEAYSINAGKVFKDSNSDDLNIFFQNIKKIPILNKIQFNEHKITRQKITLDSMSHIRSALSAGKIVILGIHTLPKGKKEKQFGSNEAQALNTNHAHTIIEYKDSKFKIQNPVDGSKPFWVDENYMQNIINESRSSLIIGNP